MLNSKLSALWYGGGYNPEQWPEEVWDEDVRIMQRAGMNTATIGVFSWVKLQPGPETYDFDWMDRLIEKLDAGGIHLILATPTAAPPMWMCRRHPDILPEGAHGVRYSPGGRRHYCPNSATYREYARDIAGRLA